MANYQRYSNPASARCFNVVNSGTKLVFAILLLALALGAVSWWYRFESAHRATEFWGPAAAELIAEPSEVVGLQLAPASDPNSAALEISDKGYDAPVQKSLTDAPGMVHLRHALLTDSNYLWMKRPATPDAWHWALKFSQADHHVFVLLTDDLTTIGKSTNASSIEPISCQPMAETLREYFTALGLE